MHTTNTTGISMAQVKDPPLVDELKGLFKSSSLLRELIDDKDMWKAMGLDGDDDDDDGGDGKGDRA